MPEPPPLEGKILDSNAIPAKPAWMTSGTVSPQPISPPPIASRSPNKKPKSARTPLPAADLDADSQQEGRALAAGWRQMAVVYSVSLLLHGAVLLILGLIILPVEVRDELLSVFAQQLPEEPPPPLAVLVEEPKTLEEPAWEDSPHPPSVIVDSDKDSSELVKMDINDDSLSIDPETMTGPAVPIPVASIAAGRSEAARGQMLAQRGGNQASDAAVASALFWLASVQREDGSWDYRDVGKSKDPGNLSSPTGATGLVLMAFLGAGHTHTKEGKYQKTVKRGLDFLVKAAIPSPEGLDFRGSRSGNEGMYVQAICATAIAEAYGMTDDASLRTIAQGATNFIVRAQHSDGGWRYRPNEAGDTSVVGWQVMALKSAKHAKISIPRTVSLRTNKFLVQVSHADGAKYSYMPDEKPRASTTAIGLLCRMYMGWKLDNPALIKGVKYLADTGPSRDDIYYDYYASQVLIQFTGAKGDTWKTWNTKMRDWLVETQKKTGPEKGSWDVIEKNHKGERGGRLYTTCMAVMTLEIYYRVLPLYQRSAVEAEF